MMDNYEDLVEAAEKATPGPWLAISSHMTYWVDSSDHFPVVHWSGFDASPFAQKASNAEYIALANPSRILALVKELREAKERAAKLQFLVDAANQVAEISQKRADKAGEELREARRPVAPADQELLALLREVRPILERVFQGKRNKDLRARIVAAIDSTKDPK